MKRIKQRVAILGFFGCLALVTIASRNNACDTCKQVEKGVFSNTNKEVRESLDDLEASDNAYELTWRGKIFNFSID